MVTVITQLTVRSCTVIGFFYNKDVYMFCHKQVCGQHNNILRDVFDEILLVLAHAYTRLTYPQ